MKIPKEYKYDIYFSHRAGSCGWATWKERWENTDWEVKDYKEFLKNRQLQGEFNKGGDDMADMLNNQMEGKIDSWAIRWCYTLFKKNAYCIYPTKSYIENIGFDGSGVHSRKTKSYSQKSLNYKGVPICPPGVSLDEEIGIAFKKVFKKSKLKKILLKLRKMIFN
jgi:hypothetical protein